MEQAFLAKRPEVTIDQLRNMLPWDLVEAVGQDVINFQFPIWDETDRAGLIHKILIHYYMREIGLETVALWKLRLYDKLNMIMPYYIRLWNSEMDAGDLWETFREHKHTDNQGTSSRFSEGEGSESIGDKVQQTDIEEGKSSENVGDTYNGYITDTRQMNEKKKAEQEDAHNAFNTQSGTAKGAETNIDSKNTVTETEASTSEDSATTKIDMSTTLENTAKDQMFSDTPQTGLAMVKEGTYLTNATVDVSNGDKASQGTAHGLAEATGQSIQKGSASDNLIGYKDSENEETAVSQDIASDAMNRLDEANRQDFGVKQDINSRAVDTKSEFENAKNRQITTDTAKKNKDTRRERGAHTGTGNVYQHGWNGDKMEALEKYRLLLLNIEEMIINELRPLFLGILG